ncbi:MAG: sugar ABC transporter substrate-binding protein [Candidatus Hydrogenedentes bacterium]|nr:sugar ABC transporter substrate-binding protein [Candidatus Hydrogenedentota bacterium]
MLEDRTRTVILLICLFLAVTGILVSCSNSTENRPRQIGFCMTLDDPYWQNMRLGALDEAKKLGVEVTITNAKEDPVLQIQQIQEMIAKQVAAVCVVPMKKEPLVSGIQALNRADIPVILVNREVAEGCDYLCFTGTDTYDGAMTSAGILMTAIGGKGGVVELHQHLGTGPEIARSRALRDAMKEHPEVTLLARAPHDGDRGKAIKEMQVLLERFPNMKGVYAHGDPYAIAAAEACRDAGRVDIAIVGMGGSAEAIAAIKEGKITGTSYQQPEEEGRSAIRLAVRCLNGETLETNYLVSCPAITKENAGQFVGQF